MPETKQGATRYDLEERTFQFAKDVRAFVKMVPRSTGNDEDIRQLVTASGSVGANYIEANESLSKRTLSCALRSRAKKRKRVAIGVDYWILLEQRRSKGNAPPSSGKAPN